MYLYKMAFYHKSMNNVNVEELKSSSYNNERLEYLGDAILNTVVAEYLFLKYPTQNEGFLTKMRSKIVKRKTLNMIADRMGVDVILSNFTQGKMSETMLGNAFEALVGAIYIECGYAYTSKYIRHKIIRKYLDIEALEQLDDNFKSRLLEMCQKKGHHIEYKLINKYKYDKRDRFKIGVFINHKEVAFAEDFNKKAAEQSASRLAINRLKTSKKSQQLT